MKVAQINMVNFGSTGKIALQLANAVCAEGGEACTFSTRVATKHYKKIAPAPEGQAFYGSFLGNNIHFVLAQMTGKNCCYSKHSTKKLIRDLERFAPDIVHLHNLHAAYLNFDILFSWLKKSGVKVVWTFHDCWPMTAKCPHFDLCGCEKWKTGCHDCRQLSQYPRAFVDRTKWLWQKKHDWFTGFDDLTVVAPSYWLADLAKQSFFKEYPICVIHTGIDLTVFQPVTEDFFAQYHRQGKYIVLGVANPWNYKKGIDIFAELAKKLDERFQIVLVGASEQLKSKLPEQIVCIPAMQDQATLARIYSSADVFANPTREETLGLVNAEALACGTPVVTFDSGGSPEVPDDSCGAVVPKDNIELFTQQIIQICMNKIYTQQACTERAKHFDAKLRLQDYLDIYHTAFARKR